MPIHFALSILVYSWLKHVPRCDCTCKVLGNPKDNYDMSVSVFVVQFNGFMPHSGIVIWVPFFLNPEDIRVLGMGAIWNFVKGTGLL